jgi:hypothetical protein
MNDILKSFGIGLAVAGALVGGTYAAARAIDGGERLYSKYKSRGKNKPAAIAPNGPTQQK